MALEAEFPRRRPGTGPGVDKLREGVETEEAAGGRRPGSGTDGPDLFADEGRPSRLEGATVGERLPAVAVVDGRAPNGNSEWPR